MPARVASVQELSIPSSKSSSLKRKRSEWNENDQLILASVSKKRKISKQAKNMKCKRFYTTSPNHSPKNISKYVDVSSNIKFKKIKKIKLILKKRPSRIRCQKQKINKKCINNKKILKPIQNKTLISYEIPVGISKRCQWSCKYQFGNYTIEISKTIGKANEIKQCISVLSQSLTNIRAKASFQTDKNCYLILLKNEINQVIACGVFHCDPVLYRVNIEMFAVDIKYRGNGLSSIMIFLLQTRMLYFKSYDLFVSAAFDAVPFWLNIKYGFVKTNKCLLEQHEIDSEKKGDTKYLIWHARNDPSTQLLECFNNFSL